MQGKFSVVNSVARFKWPLLLLNLKIKKYSEHLQHLTFNKMDFCLNWVYKNTIMWKYTFNINQWSFYLAHSILADTLGTGNEHTCLLSCNVARKTCSKFTF